MREAVLGFVREEVAGCLFFNSGEDREEFDTKSTNCCRGRPLHLFPKFRRCDQRYRIHAFSPAGLLATRGNNMEG